MCCFCLSQVQALSQCQSSPDIVKLLGWWLAQEEGSDKYSFNMVLERMDTR